MATLTLFFLPFLCIAAGKTVLHEQRAHAPSGFANHGAASAAAMLTLRVALTSNDEAGLDAKLASLSTPGSPEFRQWLSMEEVKTFVQPSAETTSAFNVFAAANGLTPTVVSPNGDWVSITLPVSQANKLFDAQFQVFSHPSMESTIMRTLSVSLPEELVGHVDVIHPTTEFTTRDPRLLPAKMNNNVDKRQAKSCDTSNPAGIITPTCLQALYGIPKTRATQESNRLLVTGYVGEYAQRADLRQFLQLLRPDIPPTTTFTLTTLDGGVNTQNASDAGVEADLDIEYTTGIATNVPVEFLSVGTPDADFATDLLDTTVFLDGVKNPPSTITTSYGSDESDFGASLATKICNGYKALGSRGISVIFASGDGGVRGGHDDSTVCDVTTFIPVFPASCPFLTSVGSTIGFAPEEAINFTGGGFSDVFPRAFYQEAAVSSFLARGIPRNFPGNFSRSGRGYPDAALQGWNFQITAGGEVGTVGGTSASSPTFASIIALINDRLVAAGKPVLGFLNPFLYEKASRTFTDITEGHNSGFVCPASSVAFDATTGWDPLTGWGTPKFAELLAAAFAE